MLVALVLGGHAALLDWLAPRWSAGAPRAVPETAVRLAWRLSRPVSAPAPPPITPQGPPQRAEALVLPRTTALPVDPTPVRAVREAVRPVVPPPGAPDDLADAALQARATALPAPEGAASAPRPVRLPPSREWRFAVQRGDQRGEGWWRWTVDGERFASQLEATLDGQPLIAQRSQGHLGSHGLAPEREVERQGRASARAVNFQHDQGVVSFSGSARELALPSGAQGRLSWLPQLLGLLAGQAGWPTGSTLVVPVAGSDGELGDWTWELADRLAPDGGAALHWVRAPRRAYDHRIDLWLEVNPPHWPLEWQWQRIPGGNAVRWVRLPEAP